CARFLPIYFDTGYPSFDFW
nr:immunoglobulin heavy chain junction region [Macaca mulatta]MOY18246.1 immunoglobulin heavy chain junction region [Macaca mulatta]MOY20683.1 immunoglobulin heavy chain junction region [Macaca mulatta]